MALGTSIPANADPPAWWNEVGPDGHAVIAPNAPPFDPKSPANIGQAKFIAKRALESLRPILPIAADTIEANLVGPGKPITSWEAPAPGTALAQAQSAPLLIGQLKAIAAPFYSALSDADSEWVLTELEENGTLDSETADHFFPWTADPADDENNGIATIGQLKAVFSLRFDSLATVASEDDLGEDDPDVVIEQDDEPTEGEGQIAYAAQAASPGGFQAAALGNQNYEIQFRKGTRKLKKHGFRPIYDTTPPSNTRYLNWTSRYLATDWLGNRIAPPWRVGYVIPPAGYVYEFYHTDEQRKVVDPLNGNISTFGTTLKTEWWEKLFFNSGNEGPQTTPNEVTEDQWFWVNFRNGYQWNKDWLYDRAPMIGGEWDGNAQMMYESFVFNKNTLQDVKNLAIANPPAYPSKWTNGSPVAAWNVWESEMGVTYSRTQFRFRRKSQNPFSVMAQVYFSPEDGGPDQWIKTVKWGGGGAYSYTVTLDPARLRPKIEGQFHIQVGTILFDLDQSQNETTAIIPIDSAVSIGGGPPVKPSPIVKFPGMNGSWFDGQASVTLAKVSGSGDGQVQFKAGTTPAPYGQNLVANFFAPGGSSTNKKWSVEGINPGNLQVKLTYQRNGKTFSAIRKARVVSGDLDIDSDNSGFIDSTIQEENIENDLTKPGKLMIVTPEWLTDANGIPDNANGLHEIKVTASGYIASDEIVFNYSGSTPGVPSSGGALRIWKKPASGPPTSTADFVIPGKTYKLWELGITPGTPKNFYVQAVSPAATKAAIEMQLSANGVVVEDRVIATLLPVEVGVDNNRDGQLDLNATSDKTTSEKPYRFWLNNDHDLYANDTYDDQQDHPWTTQSLDNSNSEIESQRDLDDLARLHLKVEGIQTALEDGSMTLGIKWKTTISGQPKIRIFKAVEAGGGTKYLSDAVEAANQIATERTALGVVQGSAVFDLPVSFWTFTSATSKKHFLFEGIGEGKGELTLVFKKNGSVIGEAGSVFLDLIDIRKMYERWKIADGANFPGPDLITASAVSGVASVADPNSHPFQAAWDEDLEDKSYIVCVHGWRKNYNGARSDEITMFKRLWHRGFKGRYAGYYWPTLTGGVVEAKFNHSEYRAWKCGAAFKDFIETQLPSAYRKCVVAHSLGNVMIGSALSQGLVFDRYALLNGAIPAQCFDPDPALKQTAATQTLATGFSWPATVSYDAWAGGDLSDDPVAALRALAYRNRVGTVGSTRLINFFLTADTAISAWEANQWGALDAIPPIPLVGDPDSKLVDGYDYDIGVRLNYDPIGVGDRALTDSHEAMAMANQSMTKAVGGEGRTAGAISGSVDMNGAGILFADQHQAAFQFVSSKTWEFYRQLLSELAFSPTP